MKAMKKKFDLDKLLSWLWQASLWNKGRIQQIVKEEIEKHYGSSNPKLQARKAHD